MNSQEEQKDKIVQYHRYFSVEFFNQTWDLIDKEKKSENDMENLIHLTHASFWHWTQVPDHTPTNISVGYWQLSRVYAIAGKGEEALYYGNQCLQIGIKNNLPPFYVGYAYEAIARAYCTMKNVQETDHYKVLAMQYCVQVTDEEEQKILKTDIHQI